MSPVQRPFRFGVVTGRVTDAAQWTGNAQRFERMGYATLLTPDSMEVLAPMTALAAAASVTSTLHLGTYVLAAPFHTAGEVAWHAATLDLLSSGRFELGLGAGRPGAESDAERLGLPFPAPGQRVDQLAGLIEGVEKALAAGHYPQPARRPPLLVAGAGRRMLKLAAAKADILALGLPPQTTEDGLAEKVAAFREVAGDRADDVELALSLHSVGPDVPEWLSKRFGLDIPALVATGATSVLTGTPREMADILLRRRERTGVSYVITNDTFAEPLAGVIEVLNGG